VAHELELPLDAPAVAPKSPFIERGFRRKMAVPASLSGKFNRRKKGEPLVPHRKIKRARFHGIFRDRMPPRLERFPSSRRNLSTTGRRKVRGGEEIPSG
jgi:hypothetical protein